MKLKDRKYIRDLALSLKPLHYSKPVYEVLTKAQAEDKYPEVELDGVLIEWQAENKVPLVIDGEPVLEKHTTPIKEIVLDLTKIFKTWNPSKGDSLKLKRHKNRMLENTIKVYINDHFKKYSKCLLYYPMYYHIEKMGNWIDTGKGLREAIDEALHFANLNNYRGLIK